ncbi:unnamed protein product [marine sediment metagenome]|uniref:Uncharacterized protein n=1 Tax=marine sediment metagenome TaxID=412755 RepID=X1Q8N8_9ZZZZ
MTQQPSAALDTIQIRYRISYLTWLRMRLWKQQRPITMSVACNMLLNKGLDDEGVTGDPAVLLGLEETKPE